MTTFAIRINYINSVRSGWGSAKLVEADSIAEAVHIAIGNAERGCFVPRYRCPDDVVEVEYEYMTVRGSQTKEAFNIVECGGGWKGYLPI
jgi:phosphosulfolactate synthase (CoM biosynthesis protein A)